MQSANEVMKKKAILVAVIALTLVAAVGAISRAKMMANNVSAAGVQPTLASVAAPRPNSSGAIPAGPPQVERNPERNAYFGETHVHTSWSFDAYVFGNTKAGPEDAYRYAMGETITHAAGYPIKITRPLDFMAVTDHAEYAGVIPLANDPSSPISKLPIAEQLKVRSKEDIQRVYLFLGGSILKNEPIKELVSPEVAGNVWKQVIGIADKYYQPGKFTTFVAYEWTSTPDNRNMHRNIIFKDSKKVPEVPFSSLDSDHPEDLWNWMDTQRKAGNRVAGHLAQRQPERWHHVSTGSGQQGAAD